MLRHLGWLQVTEAQLQDAIVTLARTWGWRIKHDPPTRTPNGDAWWTAVSYDGAGYPDLTCVHPQHGVMFIELKAKTGRPTDNQKEWLGVLHTAGANVYLIRPEDWRDGWVEHLFRRGPDQIGRTNLTTRT